MILGRCKARGTPGASHRGGGGAAAAVVITRVEWFYSDSGSMYLRFNFSAMPSEFDSMTVGIDYSDGDGFHNLDLADHVSSPYMINAFFTPAIGEPGQVRVVSFNNLFVGGGAVTLPVSFSPGDGIMDSAQNPDLEF